MLDQITIRVPATSANLGPGFDCLGVALNCYNLVCIMRKGTSAPHTMVDEAAATFFYAAGVSPFQFSWTITGDIPRSRGLGSSVAVRLGVLHALNALSSEPLDTNTLYRLCVQLEGHPDNAAPAAFGGFAVARPDTTYFRCDVSPSLHFIVLLPTEEIETDVSRGRLPREISHADAVWNTAHASLLTAAFVSQQYDLLRGTMRDHLHEPYRLAVNPYLRAAVEAGVSAGALGGYLSGSGSAIACVSLKNPEAVATAMRAVAPDAKTLILHADNTGITVVN